MAYYEQIAGPELADDFYAELRRFMLEAVQRPESFSIRERDLRRVNPHRFPYHFRFSHRGRRRADPGGPASSKASVARYPTHLKVGAVTDQARP